MKLWVITLDFGSKGTPASLALLNIDPVQDGSYLLTENALLIATCPYVLTPDTPRCGHLLSDRLDASVTPSDLVDHIVRTASEPEHFSTVLSLGLSLHKVN